MCHCTLIILLGGRYSLKQTHILSSVPEFFSQFHLNYAVWRKYLNIWVSIIFSCNDKKSSNSHWIFFFCNKSFNFVNSPGKIIDSLKVIQ